MAVSVFNIAKFVFALKNLSKNMYHMYILRNYPLPDPAHSLDTLEVHLVPQDGLKSP